MAQRTTSAKSKTTVDHEVIRKWAEERDGHPARVKDSGSGKGRTGGILRIDFGKPEASLEKISWEEFFKTFDENNLAFLYQETTSDGSVSRFFKFVNREGNVDDEDDDVEDDDGEETELDEKGRVIIVDVDEKSEDSDLDDDEDEDDDA